ncbi:MAG: hypothetical protein ACMXYC_01335 [Candidatus Woesearchaeota archaeon]
MPTKSQTAVEFLIIVSVLVLLFIGIASFGQLGTIFKQQSIAPHTLAQAPIGIVSYAINTTHIVIFVQNNNVYPINITHVHIDGTSFVTGTTLLQPLQQTTYTLAYISFVGDFSYHIAFTYQLPGDATPLTFNETYMVIEGRI